VKKKPNTVLGRSQK